MELYQLRTFVQVAKEGNLSRAARSLATSQPAVSAQIKALEEEWGGILFERTPRGMTLTPVGTCLLAKAQDVLDSALQLTREAVRLRGEPEGTLRLGALSDPALLRLGQVLTLLQERHPGLGVDLRHATSGVVRESLLAGNLEAGWILGPSEPGLERRDLCPMRLVVVVPPDADPDLPWDRICQSQWIGTPPGCPFQILGEELFAREGRRPERIFRAEIERTIVEMVSAGLGAGLLREDTARWAVERGKCRLWEGQGLDTTVALVWRRGHGDDLNLAALRRIVDEVWG